MKKYLVLLGFILCWFLSNSQPVVPRSNGSITIQDYRVWPLLNFLLPRYRDTATANLTQNIGLDSCGALISLYDNTTWVRKCNPKRWEQVGGASVNIYNSDGSLTANRTVDIGTKQLKFTSASSTTNPAGQMLWAQKIDTFTNGAGFIEGLSIYGNKRNLFPNSIQSNYMGGYLFNSNYEAKDSVYIYSVGGDFGWNLNSNMTLTKYPSFTGRTVIQGGTVDFDAVPNMFSQITTSGSTSSVNNVHAKGWWANNTSFVNLSNVNDTLDNFISYFSGGLTTGKLRKHYIVYGKDLGNTDSSWGAFFPSTTTRNVLGGNTSIGSSTNSGPTHTLEVFGNQTIKGNDSVGSRLTSDWTQGSLPSGWSDNTPGTSLTFTGAGMAVSGGAQDLNNHLDQGFYIGSPFWTIHQKVIVGSKNGTSYGFGFELKPAVGNGQTYLASYLLADTTGYIAFTGSNSFPTSSDPNNRANLTFKWSVGDTLDCYIVRQDRTAIITMYNLTTGMTSQLTYSVLFTGTSNLQLHFYGGSFTFIGSLDLTYNLVRNPAKIGLGTSLMWGANATVQDSTFFSLSSSRVQGAAYNFGHPSEQAINGIENLEDILTYAQANQNTVVEVEYGVNEHNNAVPLDTFGARLRRICTPLIASGCKVILINCVPQLTSVVSTNDTINSVANSFTPHIRVADIYTALVGTGTAINPLYAYGDNVHINNKGGVQAAGVIWEQEKDLLTIGSPVNATPLPTISNPVYYVGMDATGNFGRTYPGTSNAFIKNTTTNDGTNIQTANFNISGAGWVGSSFLVQGFGNFSSPSFGVNVNADGYTKAALFLSKNFATSTAGYSYIDGTLSADPRLIFFSGAYIGAHQMPLLIKPDDATTGAIGLRITNGTNSAVPSTYKIQTFERNTGSGDVVKAFVDRGGGAELDSTLRMPNIFSAPGDTTTWKPVVIDGSGNVYKGVWAFAGGGGGSGTNNANVGAGYRWLKPSTQEIYTFFAGAGITLDSVSNANGLTIASSGTSTAISALTVAAATNDIDNTQYRQRWRWTTLAGDTAIVINSTATTAASNAQVGVGIMLKGANATASQTTKALYVANTHTGTSPVNIGIYSEITGASTTSRAGYFDGGISARGTDLTIPQIELLNSAGGIDWRFASAQLTGSGNGDVVFYNGVTTNGGAGGVGVLLDYQTLNFAAYGGATTLFQPSAKLHAASGNTAAGTAPLKLGFIAPVLNTVAEKYALEIDSTTSGGNIYYTNAGATRYTLAKTLTNTATLDFPSTAASSSSDLTITVTNAADGQPVIVTPPNGSANANCVYTAWVSSANTITVRFSNLGLVSAVDPASGTFRASVLVY